MKKPDKKLLATYMSLDSKNANEYLSKLAVELKNEITESENNDEIQEYLDLLESFVYKVPKITIEIVRVVLNKKPNQPPIHKTPLGNYRGKSYKNLIVKCIEILRHIRYIAPNEVLELSTGLSSNEDTDIKNEALELVKKFSQYDYNLLTKSKLGYAPQRTVLDYIAAWPSEQSIENLDFVETATKELLSSSVEGTEMTDEKTLTIRFAAVDPTNFLKKIRRDTIDYICRLYEHTDNPKNRLRLVNILNEVTSTPSNVAYGDNIVQMIKDDLNYLVEKYQQIIFGDSGDIIANLGVVKEIEERLYWIHKWGERDTKDADALREQILRNTQYKLFRLLIGRAIVEQEDDWRAAEEKRDQEIDSTISSIEESRYLDWFINLNTIASVTDIVADWEFGPFKSFIEKLSRQKPILAKKILAHAFEQNGPLLQFVGSFLNGFRTGNHFTQWDEFVDVIIAKQSSGLVKKIVYSLHLPLGVNPKESLRDADIATLHEIVSHEKRFSFVQTDDRELHHALFNTLCRDYERDPKIFEKLMWDEIKNNPGFAELYLSEMQFILWKNWIPFDKLSKSIVDFFIEKIVTTRDLDWHIQGLLLAIGKREGLKSIMDVFEKRILFEVKNKESRKSWLNSDRYDAVPNHFNPDLREFISSHPDYLKIAGELASKMTTDWSIYNWNIGEFFQEIGRNFDEIVMALIQKGDDENLMRAARALFSISGADFKLCIEIVRRTQNEGILNEVRSAMYGTGVVSGEYGLSNAYVAKASALEKYKEDQSDQVKDFVQQMIVSFTDRAAAERKRADEEIQLRKIEFEG